MTYSEDLRNIHEQQIAALQRELKKLLEEKAYLEANIEVLNNNLNFYQNEDE
jgi:cell division protein FtsB